MERLIDIKGLSEFLNIEITTLYNNYIKWHMPFIKIGGNLRFNPVDIEIWLQNNQNTPFKRAIKNKETKAKRECHYTSRVKSTIATSKIKRQEDVLENPLDVAISKRLMSFKGS